MEMTEKEKAIHQEKIRLGKVFEDLDGNKKKVAMQLIARAAFLSVTLEDLEDEINAIGTTTRTESGLKQHAAAATHIAMTKNLTSITKQLLDLVPAEKKKKSRLQELRDE